MQIIYKPYRDFWKFAFDFHGKANRGQYFWSFLVNFLILFIINILIGTFKGFGELETLLRLLSWYIIPLIFFIPDVSITMRRLRDTGLSPMLGIFEIIRNAIYFLFLIDSFSRIGSIIRIILFIVAIVIFLLCLRPSNQSIEREIS